MDRKAFPVKYELDEVLLIATDIYFSYSEATLLQSKRDKYVCAK